jgi:hypothetical protein
MPPASKAQGTKALDPDNSGEGDALSCGEVIKKASAHVLSKEARSPTRDHSAEALRAFYRGALAFGNAAASCSCQIPRVLLKGGPNLRRQFKQVTTLFVKLKVIGFKKKR